MITSNGLRLLDCLSNVMECGLLGYNGELKTELKLLCVEIENAALGDVPARSDVLASLCKSLDCYEADDYRAGASNLARASRAWWNSVASRQFCSDVDASRMSFVREAAQREGAMGDGDDVGIQEFVKRRGINSLLHFTRAENVPGILQHGLLGREALSRRGLVAQVNDRHRYDRMPDAICTSISFPNYKMFYGLQQANAQVDWAVLRISPSVLWELPCVFCISNAASSEVTDIPVEGRKGLAAFESLFQDIPPDIRREDLKIPDNYTTDPQAEVLVLSPIDTKYIVDVNINVREKITDFRAVSDLFSPFIGEFKFRHDGSFFTYRRDYNFWRRELESPEKLVEVDFSKFF